MSRISNWLKSNLQSTLFKHISILFMWDNLSKITVAIITIILIRTLSKEDYALYTFFLASLNFFVGLMSSGIDTAYIRFSVEEYSITKKMPNDILIFSTVLCLFIFLGMSPIIFLFSKSTSLLIFKNTLYGQPLLFGFIAALGFFLITIVARYYQAQEKYVKSGFISNLDKPAFLIFLLILLLLGKLNFLRLAFLQIFVVSFFGILFIGLILKNDLAKEKLVLNFHRFKNFLKDSFWLIMYFLTSALFNQLDMFMISRMLTSKDLANYGVAFKYYTLLIAVYPSIRIVLNVRTSGRDMIENPEKQKIFLKKWIKTTIFLFIPLFALILLFSGHLMNLLNGKRYSASILPFKFLVICAMINYILPVTNVFLATKRYFLLFCFGIVALVINFFMNLWLIPNYGINGAAISLLVSFFILEVMALYYIMAQNK